MKMPPEKKYLRNRSKLAVGKVLTILLLSRNFKCNFWCEICRKPNYFRPIHVFDRTVKMAREKHLG